MLVSLCVILSTLTVALSDDRCPQIVTSHIIKYNNNVDKCYSSFYEVFQLDKCKVFVVGERSDIISVDLCQRQHFDPNWDIVVETFKKRQTKENPDVCKFNSAGKKHLVGQKFVDCSTQVVYSVKRNDQNCSASVVVDNKKYHLYTRCHGIAYELKEVFEDESVQRTRRSIKKLEIPEYMQNNETEEDGGGASTVDDSADEGNSTKKFTDVGKPTLIDFDIANQMCAVYVMRSLHVYPQKFTHLMSVILYKYFPFINVYKPWMRNNMLKVDMTQKNTKLFVACAQYLVTAIHNKPKAYTKVQKAIQKVKTTTDTEELVELVRTLPSKFYPHLLTRRASSIPSPVRSVHLKRLFKPDKRENLIEKIKETIRDEEEEKNEMEKRNKRLIHTFGSLYRPNQYLRSHNGLLVKQYQPPPSSQTKYHRRPGIHHYYDETNNDEFREENDDPDKKI